MAPIPQDHPTKESPWTEQQVRELVESGDYAYQRLDLPYGLTIEGDDRRGTCARIFPDDMTGLSVLDIGCQNGFFCFEAVKRGATRVLGCDVDPQCVDRARVLAEVLGVADKVEFRVIDVETQAIDERFDYVLCLNVTHHLLDPIAVIEKLADVARDRLILELAGLGRKDRKRLKINRLQAFVLRNLPVIMVGDSGFCARHHHRGYLISPQAVRNMLTMHRNSCARVDTLPSDFKDRDIAIAHKRRIKHLIVVAGMPCGGKSHLIRAMQGQTQPGDRPLDDDVKALLGGADPGDWPVVIAGRAHKLTDTRHEGVILEYNTMHVHFGSAKHYQRDETLHLLNCADKITAISLFTPADKLLEHLDARGSIIADKKDADEFDTQHQRLRNEYRDWRNVRRRYVQWLDFADTVFDNHTIVSYFDEPKLRNPAQWRNFLESTAAPQISTVAAATSP